MSALTEEIKAALYAKLNVSGVTSLATDGVSYGEAKRANSYKALIFEKASNRPEFNFGFTLAYEDSLWNVKTFTKNLTEGEELINTAISTIGNSLTLATGTCLGVMRFQDLPELKQPLTDENVWMIGVQLRIWAE